MIINDYLKGVEDVTTADVIGYIKEQEYWREFLYANLKDKGGLTLAEFVRFLKEHEEDITVWMEIGERKDSLRFSILYPNESPKDRVKYNTYFISEYELERIDAVGAMETLEGKDQELAQVMYEIRKYERFSRELRKRRKELEEK